MWTNFSSMQRDVASTHKKISGLSAQEARTLPTVAELRAAYHAAAHAYFERAKQKLAVLESTLNSKKISYIPTSQADEVRDLSILLWKAEALNTFARVLRKFNNQAQATYVTDIVALIDYRRGFRNRAIPFRGMDENIYSLEFADVFKHLPEPKRAVLPRVARPAVPLPQARAAG